MNLVGHADEISRARIVGWVVDTDQPAQSIVLDVVVNGEVYASGAAARRRAGLSSMVPGALDDAHEYLFEFQPPLSPFSDFDIRLRLHEPPFTEIDGSRRKLSAPISRAGALTPIIVNSAGRSGSTFLTHHLLSQPTIVGADVYPFETKLLAYYAAALRVLSGTADRLNSTSPEALFDGVEEHRIGKNPFFIPEQLVQMDHGDGLLKLFQSKVPDKLSDVFRASISEFYSILKVEYGKPAAGFFVEKGELHTEARCGARSLFSNVREVLLIRDPRDLVCSAMRFWRLTFEEALANLAAPLERIRTARRGGREDLLVVRYEDLFEPDAEAFKALSAYLGVTVPPPDGVRTAELTSHATSASAADSVGRWRTDLTADQIRTVEDVERSSMAEFGYG